LHWFSGKKKKKKRARKEKTKLAPRYKVAAASLFFIEFGDTMAPPPNQPRSQGLQGGRACAGNLFSFFGRRGKQEFPQPPENFKRWENRAFRALGPGTPAAVCERSSTTLHFKTRTYFVAGALSGKGRAQVIFDFLRQQRCPTQLHSPGGLEPLMGRGGSCRNSWRLACRTKVRPRSSCSAENSRSSSFALLPSCRRMQPCGRSGPDAGKPDEAGCRVGALFEGPPDTAQPALVSTQICIRRFNAVARGTRGQGTPCVATYSDLPDHRRKPRGTIPSSWRAAAQAVADRGRLSLGRCRCACCGKQKTPCPCRRGCTGTDLAGHIL